MCYYAQHIYLKACIAYWCLQRSLICTDDVSRFLAAMAALQIHFSNSKIKAAEHKGRIIIRLILVFRWNNWILRTPVLQSCFEAKVFLCETFWSTKTVLLFPLQTDVSVSVFSLLRLYKTHWIILAQKERGVYFHENSLSFITHDNSVDKDCLKWTWHFRYHSQAFTFTYQDLLVGRPG